MKSIAKFLALGVIAVSATLTAHATPFALGSVAIGGGNGSITTTPTASSPYVSSATTSITFAYGDQFTLGPGSGSLGSLPPTENTTFVTTSTFTVGGGVPNPPVVFGFVYAAQGGNVLYFFANNVISLSNTVPGTLEFQGYVEESAVGTTGLIASTITTAIYDITPAADGKGEFSGSLTVAPTPEPSSLLLLGTGLASAAGIVFRKRRAIA